MKTIEELFQEHMIAKSGKKTFADVNQVESNFFRPSFMAGAAAMASLYAAQTVITSAPLPSNVHVGGCLRCEAMVDHEMIFHKDDCDFRPANGDPTCFYCGTTLPTDGTFQVHETYCPKHGAIPK